MSQTTTRATGSFVSSKGRNKRGTKVPIVSLCDPVRSTGISKQ